MSLISDVVSYQGWNSWRCLTLFHFKHTSELKPSEDTLVNNKETAIGREKCELGFLDCFLWTCFQHFSVNKNCDIYFWVRDNNAGLFTSLVSSVLPNKLLFSVEQSNSPFLFSWYFFFAGNIMESWELEDIVCLRTASIWGKWQMSFWTLSE